MSTQSSRRKLTDIFNTFNRSLQEKYFDPAQSGKDWASLLVPRTQAVERAKRVADEYYGFAANTETSEDTVLDQQQAMYNALERYLSSAFSDAHLIEAESASTKGVFETEIQRLELRMNLSGSASGTGTGSRA
ncbi:uncharacterized protein I303_104957 [Kwoniella dejecticola CBS 10117]|uniref:Uncharacterized protein n=1 Tax=Kwoniella dejecticola CBS 10117 TaxID=1296121 RepID=A0A1A6A3V1_9TREE|nr:uncharacterized protein I303_05597 [Kwoniella dejecticola CBS 10117]OBR84738.1 hypothetical protein I303_05597 [Kwoniella dejecticola CBS 10117]